MNHQTDDRAHLWQLIQDIRFAMFTTRHGNGHLHSRPMTTQNGKLDVDDKLWFFMSRSSDPVSDLDDESTVNIAYADPSQDSYVSVSGTARVVEDKAKTQELWSTIADAWFPGGANDPNLALVEVTITHAHYWDVKEGKLTQLFLMAKSSLTGTPPSLGESAEVRMAATSHDGGVQLSDTANKEPRREKLGGSQTESKGSQTASQIAGTDPGLQRDTRTTVAGGDERE